MQVEDLTSFLSATKAFYAIAGSILLSGSLFIYLISSTPSILAKRAHARLPPGPKMSPVIGSLLSMPKKRWYETFTEWQKVYGDIIYLNLAGKSMIVINSLPAAEELMNKRTDLTSQRPHRTMINEIMSVGWALILLQPSPDFNEQRKIFRKTVGPQVIQQYDHLIRNEVQYLLEALPITTGDPFQAVVSAVGAVIIKAAYGERVYQEHGKHLVEVNRTRSKMLTSALQSFWLVDIFPSLKHVPSWFPGATFKRFGESGTELARKVRWLAYDLVNKAIMSPSLSCASCHTTHSTQDEGTADPSIIANNINQLDFSNDNLRDSVASMYAAGADTTATSIVNFFHSMLLHPEVQSKIHAELDEFLGGNMSPSMQDIRRLPYFNAVWKESMRLYTPVPLGLPHVFSEAEVWGDFYIPKGTIAQCNIGFMLRDPRVWGADSESFKPERFLPESNPKSSGLSDIMGLVFGFGRRVCPGLYLAERVGMQFAASTLSTFRIVPVEGVPVSTSFDDSTIRRPSNFCCQFIARY